MSRALPLTSERIHTDELKNLVAGANSERREPVVHCSGEEEMGEMGRTGSEA